MGRIANGYTRVRNALFVLAMSLTCFSIYKEIGPGIRISLAKLASDHLEKTNRCFRVAVDISIWQFQIQSGQGGQNPALRTLYYRLLKLLGLGIQPLFVFDGPYKPALKRNAKMSPYTACLDNFLTKELLGRFGFPYHDAPGEAEAECALLQREGFVDAVLSEDVDTLMFGCRMSLRCWTSEGTRNSKTPTHITMYTAESTMRDAGLDREGMILVALMSGGDYDTDGLSKCGPKIACEAARAGFGRQLYQLAEDDNEGWRKWRETLEHELHTNESKFFKQKHKGIVIPETFPDRKVFGYYKRPTVSSSEKIVRLKESTMWQLNINIPGMRAFVAEAFNWTYLIGAKHFIRTLAPVLLAHKLLTTREKDDSIGEDLQAKAIAEARYVTAIHGRRHHWNTDGCPELRITYIPADIVGLDLSVEEDIPETENPKEDIEVGEVESDCGGRTRSVSPTKRRGPSTYDPSSPETLWILETTVKLGVPLLVETWEEDMRNPTKFATRKARQKKATSKRAMAISHGAMDRYVKVIKPIHQVTKHYRAADEDVFMSSSALPSLVAPSSAVSPRARGFKASQENVGPIGRPEPTKSSRKKTKKGVEKGDTGKDETTPELLDSIDVNPWSLARRPSDTYSYRSPVRYSALGIYAPNDQENCEPRIRRSNRLNQHGGVDSDFVLPRTSAPQKPLRKHPRTISISPDLPGDHDTRTLDNVTLRTPRPGDGTRASRAKKQQSICETRDGISLAMQLETPASSLGQSKTQSSMQRPKAIIDLSLTSPLAPRTPLDAAARKENSDRTRAITPAREASPESENSPLPSPSMLFLSGKNAVTGIGQSNKALRIRDPKSFVTGSDKNSSNKASRKLVMVRESLEGAWRHLEPWEVVAEKDILTSVEVVDLTVDGRP